MARKRQPAESAHVQKARAAKRESKHVEFKEQFDPSSDGEWCELIKDFIAIGNSGGGVIVIGLTNIGAPSGADVRAVLALDNAKIGDKIVKYTGENIAGFEVYEIRRAGRKMAAIAVAALPSPVTFTQVGSYPGSDGKPKTAFARGTVYVRHGAKSEPATTNDLREVIDRRVAEVRDSWLSNIRKVVSAPEGSEIAIFERTSTGASGEPTEIRLTTEPNAPVFGKLDSDKTHPYRQKELVREVNKRLSGKGTINSHDVVCVRRVHGIDDHQAPDFCHKPKFASMQYSDVFVDWLVKNFGRHGKFFAETRATDLQRRRSHRQAH